MKGPLFAAFFLYLFIYRCNYLCLLLSHSVSFCGSNSIIIFFASASPLIIYSLSFSLPCLPVCVCHHFPFLLEPVLCFYISFSSVFEAPHPHTHFFHTFVYRSLSFFFVSAFLSSFRPKRLTLLTLPNQHLNIFLKEVK